MNNLTKAVHFLLHHHASTVAPTDPASAQNAIEHASAIAQEDGAEKEAEQPPPPPVTN